MEIVHLNILLENGFVEALMMLYDASEKKSICRSYMDSYEFRQLYLSRQLQHKTFKDVSSIVARSCHGKLNRRDILALAKKGYWNDVKELFDEALSRYKYENEILETLLYSVKEGRLDLAHIYMNNVSRGTSNRTYLKILYKLVLMNADFIEDMPQYCPNGNEEVEKYMRKIEFGEQLLAFIAVIYGVWDVTYTTERVKELVDLNTTEGRLLYSRYNGPPLSRLVDLSCEVNYLLYALTLSDFNERVELLSKRGVTLNDFSDEHFKYIQEFKNKL